MLRHDIAEGHCCLCGTVAAMGEEEGKVRHEGRIRRKAKGDPLWGGVTLRK